MKTITLSPSQYRVVRSSSSSAVNGSVECSSTARASRMSQSSSTVQAMITKTKPARTTTTLLPATHPIYGLVNLALLAVSIYLLWANFL